MNRVLDTSARPLRVAVIGGSLGGLCAAHALRNTLVGGVPCEVEIFEKSSHDMGDRGAGLVVQADVLHLLETYHIAAREVVGVPSLRRQYLARDGKVVHAQNSYQLMTSWDTIYGQLREVFPDENYHHDFHLRELWQDESEAKAVFSNGHETTCDLLVCCDGANSTARRLLLPDAKPEYAGYVAWRGLVDESTLSPEAAQIFAEKFTFFQMPHSHILCYLIPGQGGELEAGKRRFNWVWYWNVAEGDDLRAHLTDQSGLVRDYSIPRGTMNADLIARQRDIAKEVLPPAFQQLVEATADPFIQPIYDLTVPQMAFGRIALMGDAAFVPRPHTSASTAKAAANATALGQAIKAYGRDAEGALKAWEPAQLRYGNHLKASGKAMGDRSQFGR